MPGEELPPAPWMQQPAAAPEPVDAGPFPPPAWFSDAGPQELQAPAAPLFGAAPEQAPQLVAPEPEQAPMFQAAPEEPLPDAWKIPAFGAAFAKATPTQQGAASAPAQAQPADPTAAGVQAEYTKTPQEFAKDSSLAESDREQVGLKVVEDGIIENERQVRDGARFVADLNRFADDKADEFDREAKAIAGTKEDRGRWFRNQSTAGKIGAMFSAIIGGLLSPYRGGQNSGLDLVMKEIDGDVEAQRQDLMNQRAGLGERRGLVNDQVNRGKNVYEAMETSRLAMLQDLKQKAEVAMGQFDPAGDSYRRAAAAVKSVDDAIAASREKQRQQMFEEGIKLRQAKAAQTSAAASWKGAVTGEKRYEQDVREYNDLQAEKGKYGGLTAEQYTKHMAEMGQRQSQTVMKNVKNADGTVTQAPVVARTEKQLTEFEEKKNALASMDAKWRRIVELRGELSVTEKSSPLYGEKMQEIEGLGGGIKDDYRKASKGGTLDEGYVKFMDTVVGDPTSIRDTAALTKGNAFMKQARDAFKREALDVDKDIDLQQFPFLHDTAPKSTQSPDRVALAGLNSSNPADVKQGLESLRTVLRDTPSLAFDPAFAQGLANAEKVVGAEGVAGMRQTLQRTSSDELFKQEFPEYSDGWRSEFTPEQKAILVKAKETGELQKLGFNGVLKRAGKPQQ